MKVQENRRPSVDDPLAMELLQMQEAAEIASNYHKGELEFTKNTNLSHIVHATLNFSQFVRDILIRYFYFS